MSTLTFTAILAELILTFFIRNEKKRVKLFMNQSEEVSVSSSECDFNL